MKSKVYAIYDELSGYDTFFVAPNSRVAARTFASFVEHASKPQFYSLYYIADYDPSIGRFDNLLDIVLVCTGSDIASDPQWKWPKE